MSRQRNVGRSDELTLPGIYKEKNHLYYEGVRKDYVDKLPISKTAKILEIGCSNGGTGHLALKQKKCAEYYGVEMNIEAAELAEKYISHVLVGNIEQMDLPWGDEFFDVLIMSEVLEHLIDPWSVLRKLHRYLKPDAMVFASSPNISHYKVILMLLKGQWNLADEGVMDRTHLRWFTPSSFSEMFDQAGYNVINVEPLPALKASSKFRVALMFGKARHLFMHQISIIAKRK